MKILPRVAAGLLLATVGSRAYGAEESAPTIGRSLFDFLVAKKSGDGDQMVYDVPFPFEKLVEELTRKVHSGQNSNAMTFPSMVLIPNGRSLQKDFANIKQPRVIVAFTEHAAG